MKKQAPRLVASSLLAGPKSAQGWLRAPYSPGPNPPKAGCELPTRRAQIRRQNDLSACLLVGIKLFCPKKTSTRTRTNSAGGFGPEIKFPHLSLAFSLILSGVPQNEVSFEKKTAHAPKFSSRIRAENQISPPVTSFLFDPQWCPPKRGVVWEIKNNKGNQWFGGVVKSL